MGSLKFNPIRLQRVPNHSVAGSCVEVIGVPLAQSTATDPHELCVCAEDGQCFPSVIEVTSRWGDNSIRWCLVKFLAPRSISELMLAARDDRSDDDFQALQVNAGAEPVVVHGDITYRFAADHCFPEVLVRNAALIGNDARLLIRGEDGQPRAIDFAAPVVQSHDPLSAEIVISGTAQLSAEGKLNIKLTHRIYVDGHLSVTLGVHNPARAKHSDGIWDLGDPGSLFFERLEFELPGTAQQKALVQMESGQDWLSAAALTLTQASSGGEHWQSPAHVNRHNECTNEFCGYRCAVDNAETATGSRAEPALIATTETAGSVAVVPVEFWQNFPGSITIDSGNIVFGVFAPIKDDCHELQGGERKQRRFDFYLSDQVDTLQQLITAGRGAAPIKVAPQAYENAPVLGNAVGQEFDAYQSLLVPSFDEQHGFFAKREQQDEFGWRNFGDVVADHETLYHDDDSYFISHYNNQYDCIYGFARQYLISGDLRWYRLMDELARHVMDIDIYHTEQDRAEYNHGLFWHTDHYQKASTGSHRTYSKDHYAADWTGPRGGGPGPEHCYTSGLKLYYFLTGNTDAKDAVVGMTRWITAYYDGTGTMIEFCKSLLSKDLKKLIAVLRRQPVLRYAYPFNRGVGNFIRALLDSYELTGESSYLREAGRVITDTFGAADDIDMRDLGDIEHTWYYTVFLQEVVRYLDTKRMDGQTDREFHHARHGLLHYARWMAEHERPYLDQPEKLEYPNDTWAAQEIRKANVLYSAYLYADTDRQTLLDRARYFRDQVISSLSQSDTLYFARIQALLLQNHGPSGLMEAESQAYAIPVDTTFPERGSLYTVGDFIKSVSSGLIRVVRSINPMREYQWVRARLDR